MVLGSTSQRDKGERRGRGELGRRLGKDIPWVDS